MKNLLLVAFVAMVTVFATTTKARAGGHDAHYNPDIFECSCTPDDCQAGCGGGGGDEK